MKGARLHDLRHFHASELLRQGVNAKVVQERLGQAPITRDFGSIQPPCAGEGSVRPSRISIDYLQMGSEIGLQLGCNCEWG